MSEEEREEGKDLAVEQLRHLDSQARIEFPRPSSDQWSRDLWPFTIRHGDKQASGVFHGTELEDCDAIRIRTEIEEVLASLDDVIWSDKWTCGTCGRETTVGYTGKPGATVSDDEKTVMMQKAENDHRPYCSGKREVESWRVRRNASRASSIAPSVSTT
jgi:hypothetical protein